MMKLLCAALIALASTAAYGQSLRHDPNVAPWNPPARYDHPYRGGRTVIVYEPLAVIHATLGVPGWGFSHLAGRDCIVHVPSELSPIARSRVIRHERGHCAGWNGNHPK